MNNINSAREVKKQNYIREKLKSFTRTLIKSRQSLDKFTNRPNFNLKLSSSPKVLIKKNLRKHDSTELKYGTKVINNIIYDENRHLVSVFKDFLLWDENSDFFKRTYYFHEAVTRLPKICTYYQSYTFMPPVYFKLDCVKIMIKFIKKKKKLLELLEDLEDKPEDLKMKKQKKEEKFSKLIKTSFVCINISNKNEEKVLNNNSLSFNVDEKSLNIKNTQNLSKIINNLSNEFELIEDNKYCLTEQNYFKQKEEKPKIFKNFEIKKLDLNQIYKQSKENLTERLNTEPKRILYKENNKNVSKPSTELKLKSIEKMKNFLNFPYSIKNSNVKKVEKKLNTFRGGVFTSIKKNLGQNLIKENSNSSKRVSSIKKKFLSHLPCSQIDQKQNTISEYSKFFPGRKDLNLIPNISPASVYNINFNLNLNLNLNMKNSNQSLSFPSKLQESQKEINKNSISNEITNANPLTERFGKQTSYISMRNKILKDNSANVLKKGICILDYNNTKANSNYKTTNSKIISQKGKNLVIKSHKQVLDKISLKLNTNTNLSKEKQMYPFTSRAQPSHIKKFLNK